ncbi:MAG: hypothetical protein IVW51_11075 [Thermaceae bacterium]|nr:hypothetical protein [Thermaceae bacterium]
MNHLDWQGLALSLLNAILTFGGGTIALAAAGWIADVVTRFIPPLRPFREMVRQWILMQLGKIQTQRAAAVVIGAEQSMNAQIKQLPAVPTPDQLTALKAQRNAEALSQAISSGIAPDRLAAQDHIERAVGQLKMEGKL